jgi:hypothetical protein
MSEQIKEILNRCSDEIIYAESFELKSHEKYSVDIFKDGKQYELMLCNALQETREQ